MTNRSDGPRTSALRTGALLDDATLDALFAEARADVPDLPASLHARLLAEAEAARPAALPLATPIAALPPGRGARAPRPAPRRNLPGWAGLVAASAAGLWLGFAAPGPLDGLADTVFGFDGGTAILGDAEDLDIILFAFDDFLHEG
jgi:hypothetical protein